MDNHKLYDHCEYFISKNELHINLENENILNGRDAFVIEALKNNFSQRRENSLEILELSISNPIFSNALVNTNENVSLTCADISEASIDYYKSIFSSSKINNNSKIKFFQCNFDTDLDKINDREFDSIIALDILEHVFDVFGFVRNCYRIMKPDGVLILRVPNVAYIKHRIGLLFGYLPITSSWFGPKNSLAAWSEQWGWEGSHIHYFTLPLLTKLVEDTGFTLYSCQDPGTKHHFLRAILPNLLFGNLLIIARKIE